MVPPSSYSKLGDEEIHSGIFKGDSIAIELPFPFFSRREEILNKSKQAVSNCWAELRHTIFLIVY